MEASSPYVQNFPLSKSGMGGRQVALPVEVNLYVQGNGKNCPDRTAQENAEL